MKDQSYSASFTVDRNPDEVFRAIKDMRGWWSQEIQGPTDKVGDVFKFYSKAVHYCTLQMQEAVPGKRVVWLVIEDKGEWKGTQLVFDIARQGDNTELHFTHQGLTPELGCFEACADVWEGYIKGSLKSLIATGKGQPSRKE